MARADGREHQEQKEQLYITPLKSQDVKGPESDGISQTSKLSKHIFALGIINAETGQGSHDSPLLSPAD